MPGPNSYEDIQNALAAKMMRDLDAKGGGAKGPLQAPPLDYENMHPELAAAHQAERNLAEVHRKCAALERAMRRIAAHGVKPFGRPLVHRPGQEALRCYTCQHWWDVGETEHHDSECAYVIASDALKSAPAGGGTP